jgi:hypothetical protein
MKQEPSVKIYHHSATPQQLSQFTNFNTTSNNFNPYPTNDYFSSYYSALNGLQNQFANFPQPYPSAQALDPNLNTQIECDESKHSEGFFKNIFKKTKTPLPLPLPQGATPLINTGNNLFDGQSPYTQYSPFNLNSYNQSIYPGNMYYNMSQPFLNNNSAAFYPQQNYLAPPSYPDEMGIQNQAMPIASDGIIQSTPFELSKQKFCHNSVPNFEAEQGIHFENEPIQNEIVRHDIERQDQIKEECLPTKPPIVYDHFNSNTFENDLTVNNSCRNNGPLANTINYLTQKHKTTTLDRALRLDNKMNDIKYNKYASDHYGPRVVNKKALSIWEIDQLINENYNTRFWKNELDELVFKKFNFKQI